MSGQRIISLGAGVQSTAMVLMAIEGRIQADYAIFADTGSEKPETYYYLQSFLLPYALRKGFRIEIIRWDGPYNTRKKPLHQWYYEDKSLPFRMNRGCTDNWKIRPLRRYLAEHEPTGAIILIGFSLDEVTRMRDSDKPQYPNEYPLIDLRLTREDLLKYFQKHKFPIPAKSGCFMCPFARKSDWAHLKREQPELFAVACEMEERAERDLPLQDQTFYPLSGSKKLRNRFPNQNLRHILDEFPCQGYCMT